MSLNRWVFIFQVTFERENDNIFVQFGLLCSIQLYMYRQIIHRPAYHCWSSKAARSIINVPKNCPCSNRQYWTNESSYHQAVAVVE